MVNKSRFTYISKCRESLIIPSRAYITNSLLRIYFTHKHTQIVKIWTKLEMGALYWRFTIIFNRENTTSSIFGI